jgi:hypothetical protein
MLLVLLHFWEQKTHVHKQDIIDVIMLTRNFTILIAVTYFTHTHTHIHTHTYTHTHIHTHTHTHTHSDTKGLNCLCFVLRMPRHGSCGYWSVSHWVGPGSVLGHWTSDWRWTKWHSVRFCFEHAGFLLMAPIHQLFVFIYLLPKLSHLRYCVVK